MEAYRNELIARFSLTPGFADVLTAVIILIEAVIVFAVALVFAGLLTWLERRISGRTQSRVGPNRVGPFGVLQWLADGVKLILKEDAVPGDADRPLFRLAPYPVMIGVFGAFAVVPFGVNLIGSDLNVGALYVLAVTSLVVVGVLMAGWASNNKWSLLGGVRAAAQIVSYEIPSALSLLTIVLLSGTLSMQGIISAQGGWPWQWFIFHSPFTFVAFFVYFTASVAEGNRIPFDLPEAESELVAGYNTEYSGIRFAGFFLGEFANVYLLNAMATTLFFGGWQVPGLTTAEQAGSLLFQFLGMLIFLGKAWVGSLVVLWMRWTLPRLRVDQLMGLCYRYLVPIATVCLIGVALYRLTLPLLPGSEWIDLGVHLATTGFGFGVVLAFFWRVIFHARTVGDRLSLFELAQRGKPFAFDPAVQLRRYGAHRRRGREAR